MTEEIEMATAEEEDYRQEEEGTGDGNSSQCLNESEPKLAPGIGRKDRRKASKKEKRKQKRKESAEKEREEEEARLNDPEELRRIQLEEEMEKERLERERREFEEKERLFLEALARRKAQEEEEEEELRRAKIEEAQKLKKDQVGCEIETNEDGEWEYIDDGPPEIIWQGNEIIVKKNKIRVKKKDVDQQIGKEIDHDRPTSNPLPPQSEAFADFKSTPMISAQQLLENVAQQIPNFGTEQDKAHCPFHLKTGACRFGSRCSRVHFYPDKSCTLLIKNMYNGPGLAWEQDEGLEYTDEEVEHSYEEFYEDVHTEFLKFGEIVNFKVCRNASYHLRGNVYVHYTSLDAAVLAYHAINGRYFAGKLVSCEFVGVTRWKVAICGEYMKSKLKTCSRGTACNFIHCFRNPGGDYEWADWDKPAPKYWGVKMAALFGYSNESGYEIEQEDPEYHRNSSKRLRLDAERYHSRRFQSKELKRSKRSPRDHYEKDESRSSKYRKRHTRDGAMRPEVLDERQHERDRSTRWHGKKREYDSESDRDWPERYQDANEFHDRTRKASRYDHNETLESLDSRECHRSRSRDTVLDADLSDRGIESKTDHKYPEKRLRRQAFSASPDDSDHSRERHYSTDSSREPSYENRDSLSSKDRLHSKRTYSSDSSRDSSDGIKESCLERQRKSQTRRNKVSGVSNDHWESGESLHDTHHQREYENAKSNLQRGLTRNSSGKRDHSRRKNTNEQDLNNDTGGRWEPDNVDARKTHKARRKSHGKSGSHDQNSEYSKESRSVTRTRSRSSKHKRKTSSRQTEPDEEYEES